MDLYSTQHDIVQLTNNIKIIKNIFCECCNKSFTPSTSRQKVCDTCADRIKREKQRNRYLETKRNKKKYN
jgi:hypothetical protein